MSQNGQTPHYLYYANSITFFQGSWFPVLIFWTYRLHRRIRPVPWAAELSVNPTPNTGILHLIVNSLRSLFCYMVFLHHALPETFSGRFNVS